MRIINRATSCFAAVLLLQSVFAVRLAAIQVVVGQDIQFSEDAFDKSIFDRVPMLEARRHCEDSLQATIGLVEKGTVLTAAQKSKLELAGQIDIHRFFARCEGAKRTVKFGSIPRDQWQAQHQRMRAETRPLTARYAGGLHDESSLFAKTLATTLDEEQRLRVDELFQARAHSTYANYIRMTLALIDQTVPLTQAQRSTITTLLLSKTDPPKSFGTSFTPLLTVLRQMQQVEVELREVFSDKEWQVIKRMIRAGEGVVVP